MFKVKNIVAGAVIGFVLSFLISIVSTHKSGTSFIRGIIFALVFAVISFAIDFVNGKFLEVETSLSDSVDEGTKKTGQRTGSVVNITIDDENLTEEDKAPSFDVSYNGNSFATVAKASTQPPVSEPQPVSAVQPESAPSESVTDSPAENKNAGFTPVTLGTPIGENEVVKNDSGPKKNSGAQDIEELPDIGEFGDKDDDGDGSVAPVINDSEFAQGGDVSASAAMTEGAEVMKQDSKIIASAIRTLLKKEDM